MLDRPPLATLHRPHGECHQGPGRECRVGPASSVTVTARGRCSLLSPVLPGAVFRAQRRSSRPVNPEGRRQNDIAAPGSCHQEVALCPQACQRCFSPDPRASQGWWGEGDPHVQALSFTFSARPPSGSFPGTSGGAGAVWVCVCGPAPV